MTDYTFEDATPVKVEGTGKKPQPNPFTDVIAAIALKVKDGKPVAKSFPVVVTGDNDEVKAANRKTLENRIRRQMSEAGEKNSTPVTVRTAFADAKNEKGEPIPDTVRVTFWTVKRQSRPKPATQTASTPQSTAVAKK